MKITKNIRSSWLPCQNYKQDFKCKISTCIVNNTQRCYGQWFCLLPFSLSPSLSQRLEAHKFSEWGPYNSIRWLSSYQPWNQKKEWGGWRRKLGKQKNQRKKRISFCEEILHLQKLPLKTFLVHHLWSMKRGKDGRSGKIK